MLPKLLNTHSNVFKCVAIFIVPYSHFYMLLSIHLANLRDVTLFLHFLFSYVNWYTLDMERYVICHVANAYIKPVACSFHLNCTFSEVRLGCREHKLCGANVDSTCAFGNGREHGDKEPF